MAGSFIESQSRLRKKVAQKRCHIDRESRIDARFCAEVSQEAVETNASSHTSELQSLRVLLSTTPYIKWHCRGVDVSMAFLEYKPAGGESYAAPPHIF